MHRRWLQVCLRNRMLSRRILSKEQPILVAIIARLNLFILKRKIRSSFQLLLLPLISSRTNSLKMKILKRQLSTLRVMKMVAMMTLMIINHHYNSVKTSKKYLMNHFSNLLSYCKSNRRQGLTPLNLYHFQGQVVSEKFIWSR